VLPAVVLTTSAASLSAQPAQIPVQPAARAVKQSPAVPPGSAPQGTKVIEGLLSYPYAPYQEGKMDPQTSGWPLTTGEEAYVLKPEHDRRPGREANQHMPAMWPVTPSAGNWGGRAWLETHAGFVRATHANPGPLDILLVGDSITMQWGGVHQHGKPFNAPWQKHFGQYRALNIGIGGDKTQNVLWRLDHGSVDELEPKVCVLMIGNNNMFFTPETGIEPAALGVKACLDNLRAKVPTALVVLLKILPAGAPTDRFYQDMKRTNEALDALRLDADPQVKVIDMWADFTHADGTLKTGLFTPDKIHLNDAGYEVWATTMKPIVEKILGGKSVGKPIVPPVAEPAKAATPSASPAAPAAKPAPAAMPGEAMLKPTPKTADGTRLVYPYAPYNEGRMDPQLTGWPLIGTETEWVAKSEYTRKPGHEVQKHLPDMWFVTPCAATWGKDGTSENVWVAHHATSIDKVKAAGGNIDIALLGDSITQHWGGGWDGVPFNAAWQKHFGDKKTVNLGIGGDRMENILWRLDHGALDGASPKVIVLKIGVNNAPLVFANGAPAASAAHAIKLCIENLRMRCPKSQIVLVKILPAFDPAKEAGKAVVDINACLDFLKLDQDPQVHILDLWKDFTNADGTLKTELYSDKHLHLGDAGYEAFAARLKQVIAGLLN
jgi:beta-glucosidase